MRTIGRRVPLPGGRAIVGGLLVSLAAVGTFAAYASATTGPKQHVLVAAIPVRAGQKLHSGDANEVGVDVPDDVRSQSLSSVSDIEGAIALAPMEPNEFITRSAIRRPRDRNGDAPVREFSFALDQDHALDGRIQRGELIDLVATYGSGPDAYTTVVARRVRVIDADPGSSGGVGSTGRITITIGLETEQQVIEAAHALEIAKMNVIRSTDSTVENDPRPANRYSTPIMPRGPTSTTAMPTSLPATPNGQP